MGCCSLNSKSSPCTRVCDSGAFADRTVYFILPDHKLSGMQVMLPLEASKGAVCFNSWKIFFWWPLLEYSSAAPVLCVLCVLRAQCVCQHRNGWESEKHITILMGGQECFVWLMGYFFNNLIDNCKTQWWQEDVGYNLSSRVMPGTGAWCGICHLQITGQHLCPKSGCQTFWRHPAERPEHLCSRGWGLVRGGDGTGPCATADNSSTCSADLALRLGTFK